MAQPTASSSPISGQPGRLEPGLRALGPPQGEVHGRMSRRREGASRSLGSDRRLMAEPVEHVGFCQLRLRKRRGHLQQGFSREHDPSLRHRPHVTCELQAEQGLKILPRPVRRGSEGVDVLWTDTEVRRVAQGGLQPGGDQEAAVRRQVADEQAERRRAGHPLAQTGRGHALPCEFPRVMNRSAWLSLWFSRCRAVARLPTSSVRPSMETKGRKEKPAHEPRVPHVVRRRAGTTGARATSELSRPFPAPNTARPEARQSRQRMGAAEDRKGRTDAYHTSTRRSRPKTCPGSFPPSPPSYANTSPPGNWRWHWSNCRTTSACSSSSRLSEFCARARHPISQGSTTCRRTVPLNPMQRPGRRPG